MVSTKRDQTSIRQKIVSVEELKAKIGPRPRKKSVVMCHGCFDVVHPGHLRHLLYAKERADILVASLTSDAHISKANHRPFVPEKLRAINLAALECVDYVIVDAEETPIANILALKPDLFAKGFEYFSGGVPPRTQAEIDALDSYGAEILFTPGDVIYSSSELIEASPPKIGAAKLQILMQAENVTFDDLRETLRKLSSIKVHVIGDTIVDSYTHCRVSGGMTKTPTISAQMEKQFDFPGGAAIVAKHMSVAGAQVTFSSVTGQDELHQFVVDDLTKEGIKTDIVVEKNRPTTNKNTFIAQNYHLLRVSKVDNRPIADKTVEHFAKSLSSSNADAFVFSDFRHGMFNRINIPSLVSAIPKDAFKAADSQVASRWGNILDFQNFDLITPNEREVRFALGDQDSVVRPLALELYKRSGCKNLILTLGERGIMTYRAPLPTTVAFFVIDSFAEHIVDAVGAGDALLAYSTLSMVASRRIEVASILGTFAAAVACEQEGNRPVRPAQVLAKLEAVEKVVTYSCLDFS